jgi:hypothetical protein
MTDSPDARQNPSAHSDGTTPPDLGDAESGTAGFGSASSAIDRTIEVIVPARIEMAATLRLLCASLGADVGLSLDEIDDLRLAVSEVFASIADLDSSSRVSVSFEPEDGCVGAMFFAIGPTPIALDELAATILRSAVDDLTIESGTVRFVKRSSESAS